jgi:hypothetical protein
MPEDFFDQLKKIRVLCKEALAETILQHNENMKNNINVDNEKLVDTLLKEHMEASKDPKHEGLKYHLARKLTDVIEKVDASQGGGYLFGLVGGSKRLKLWRNILTLYEKQNVYLGEIATQMITSVKYDMYVNIVPTNNKDQLYRG